MRGPGRIASGGYSLIEILVASCLLAVLFGAALFVWIQFGRQGDKGYASVHAMRDLNLVFVRMRDDLGSLIVDRSVAGPGGATIDICLTRTRAGETTRELRFFKVYDRVPETLQPVAGQIAYSLEGSEPPYTLRRSIFPVTASGLATSATEHKDYCLQTVQDFRVGYYHRDLATGDLTEMTGDVVRYDSAQLPDCLFVEVVHRDATRIHGYVTVTARYVRTGPRARDLYYVDNWLVPSDGVGVAAPVAAVAYQPGNSLNVGGTGIVLSAANLR